MGCAISNTAAISFYRVFVNKLPFGSRASFIKTQIFVARCLGHVFVGVRMSLRDDFGRLNRTRGCRFRQRRTIARRISLATGSRSAGTDAMRAALPHLLIAFLFFGFSGVSVSPRPTARKKMRASVWHLLPCTRYVRVVASFFFLAVTHCDFVKVFTLFTSRDGTADGPPNNARQKCFQIGGYNR